MPQTAYSCAAYAIHSNLTGFSPTLQFYTLSKAPKSQPASLAAMVGKNFISLKWSNALFPISGASKAGYLILYSTNIPFINPNANGAIPTAVIGKTTKVAIIENRLPALPSTEGTINNLSPDSLYNFMLIPFTWDGKNKTTYNYLINNALKISAKPAPSIFTWNCDSTGSWSNASNWIPIKVPSNGDSVQFISSKPTVVTNIPTLSLSQLLLKDSSKVSFIANGTRILSIGGAINNQFNISPNASLTLKGSDAILLKILTGNKASIAGKFTMIKGPHRLIGDDSLSIKFTNSGSFYAGDSVVKGFSGAPFNTTGKDSCIVFENGASYYQYEGLSPFGLKAPNSKILLRSTSNYFVRTSGITSPDFSGRTYGNLFLEKNTLANTNATGDWQFNSLSVDSGSSLLYNGSAASKVNIQGNIFSKSNDSISLLSGSGGINFIGTGIQLVGSGNGTGVITLNRINIPQGSSVNLLQNVNNTIATKISGTLNCGSSILYGTGSFNLTFAATIGIGDSNGIRSIGSLGNIQTTVRTFSSGANYIYNANGDQETGSFITTPNIATVNSLTFEGIGKTTLSSNFTVSSIHNSPYAISLKSGLLDLNGNTLNIPLDGKINSSGGNFTGNTGTINFDGKGTISGNISLPNVIISKTIDFGNASLITNSLQINNGGSVVNNAPIFGTNSTLIYNAGNTYSRGLEWSTMSGKGYPNNVVIKGNTTLDVSANGFADRTIAGNLMLGFDNTSGSLTMGAMPNKLTIGGNINIGTNTGNSTLSLSTKAGGDLYLNGNWSRTSAGALVANNRSIYFNGTSDQTIAVSGGETFSFLKINKPSGKVRLLNDLTLSTNLSFLTGNVGDISTEANSIIISSGQTVGITRLGGGFIIGTLKRFISAGSNLSYLFPTGTNAGYSPVSITFTNVTASGYITSAAFDFDHPVFPPNINNNKSVNKYWRLNNNDVILDTYKARFYFLNTDIDPQSTPSTFIVGKYSSNMWTYPLVTARSGTFTEVSGENTFGDFAIGQQGCAAPTTINAIINNPTCNGSANGNIVINTSGGTSPFDFSWTGPNNFTSNNQSVSNLDTGSYQLTVIAVDGCSIKKNYQLTQPPALSATLSFGAIACKGSSTNIITAAIGGTGNYQYTLSDGVNTTSPQVSNSFTVLAGTYTITVVDENFCSFSSKPIIINQPDSIGNIT